MIQLTCTNCQAVLHIDDGFAGGVCRCQHCGTIQTVPSQLKGNASSTAAPKALFKQKVAAGQRGTGLDQLAEVVSGSGLVGTGLTSGRLQQAGPARSGNRLLLPGGLAAVVIVATVVVTVLIMKGSGGKTGGGATIGADGRALPAAPAGQSFISVSLKGPRVAYVIDHGSGSSGSFDSMLKAMSRSAKSLGSEMRYCVVLWQNRDNEGMLDTYPSSGMAAGGGNAEAAYEAMAAVGASGRSELAPAIRKALELKADEIIVATGKYDLDKSDVDKAAEVVKGKARVYTFAFPGCSDSASLKRLADAGGGAFHQVTTEELSEWGQ